MPSRGLSYLGYLALLFVATVCTAQEFVPVPAAHLKGTTLSLPDLGISLSAPNEHWEWAVLKMPASSEKAALYRCRLPNTGTYFTFGIDESANVSTLDEEYARRWLSRMQDALQRQLGERAALLRLDRTDVPLAGSYKYSLQTGTPSFVHGYISQWGGVIFTFDTFAQVEFEPPAFQDIVRTFRVGTSSTRSEPPAVTE